MSVGHIRTRRVGTCWRWHHAKDRQDKTVDCRGRSGGPYPRHRTGIAQYRLHHCRTQRRHLVRAGTRAPHCWIGERRSTVDMFGDGFVLVRVWTLDTRSSRLKSESQSRFRSKAGCSSVAGLPSAAAERGVPLNVIDLSCTEASAIYQKPLVPVRPDRNVARRGVVLPDDPLARPATPQACHWLAVQGSDRVPAHTDALGGNATPPRASDRSAVIAPIEPGGAADRAISCERSVLAEFVCRVAGSHQSNEDGRMEFSAIEERHGMVGTS